MMKLTTNELSILEELIGQKPFRIFCPSPNIIEGLVETSSYTFWQNNEADFISIYYEWDDEGGTLHVERSKKPFEIEYSPDTNSISGSGTIFVKDGTPISSINVYCDDNRDCAIEMVGTQGSLFTILLDWNELCFYRRKAEDLSELNLTTIIHA